MWMVQILIGQSESVHCFVSGDEIFNIRAWQPGSSLRTDRAKHWKIKLVVASQFRGVLTAGWRGAQSVSLARRIYSIIVFCLGVTRGPNLGDGQTHTQPVISLVLVF